MYKSLISARTLLLTLATLHLTTSQTPESTLETPTDAVVIGHNFPECGGHRVGGFKSLNVPVDRCLTTPGFGLEIKKAAVCANGTRAQLARFPEKKCGYGVLDEKYGLVDISDEDVGEGSCLQTGVTDDGQVKSVAFWCDGVKKTNPEDDVKEPEKEKEDKSHTGTTSESACMAGKAPFFDHPKTDTCVNLRTEKLMIFNAGICRNGTQSTLALYSEKSCGGAPTLRDVKEDDTNTCMDLTGMSSYAFYCTGEGIQRSPNGSGPPRQGGSVMHFLLVLTLICMMFFLMLVLSIWTWVRRYGGSVGKLVELMKNVMKPKEGEIAI